MKVDLNDQYLFFSVHFVEEKAFSSRLEICLKSNVHQNVSEHTKSSPFYQICLGEHAPRPP